jgi:hypothetical protein
MADVTNDKLSSTEKQGLNTSWDWKSSYVSSLAEDGLERFSQFSASPDTTVLYAGPARFTGLSNDASALIPIGLADQISIQSNPALARLFEIGSNRSFFTRGKTASAMSLGRMLCDQKNLLAALTQNSYKPKTSPTSEPGSASPNKDIMMNIDSEYFAVPFGLMMLFKTRGGGTSGEGKVLTAVYLEYCMLSSYAFQIASASPVIVESVGIEFDRMLPISLN